jgi:1-acyl-sn-glycerol-3-phosphate acyltransferase
MRIFQKIASVVMAFWALMTFALTFLIVFIPSMLTWLIPDPLGQRLFMRIARTWMSSWLHLTGCPILVKGRTVFENRTTYIVTFNHNSLMDVPLSCPFIPGPNKTIAKTSFTRIPLFGLYYRKGAVLVDRKSEESRRRSYEKMKKVLRRGMHMSVYPEGTRNRTGAPLKKFHDGAFRLAVETGHSVIPAVIFHTDKVLPAGAGFSFHPHRLVVQFLPPVSPAGKTVEVLREEVFQIMWNCYTSSPIRTMETNGSG